MRDAGAREGGVTLFIRHTSASLTIQENADPTCSDLTTVLKRLAPENGGWRHDTEGPDDMPAHIKTMLTATSLHVPVLNGELALGTWQAIYLIEHRARPHRREMVLQFIGNLIALQNKTGRGSLRGRLLCVVRRRAAAKSGLADIDVLGLRQEEEADDRGDRREDDRIPEPGIDIAGRCHDRERGRGQQSAEPAVADVIGQRHRGVADPGREQFDQHRRDRAVNHGHEDHQDEQQSDDRRDLRTEDLERVDIFTMPASPGFG